MWQSEMLKENGNNYIVHTQKYLNVSAETLVEGVGVMKTELFLKEKECQLRFKSRKSMVVVLQIYTGREYQTSGVWY